MRSTEEQANIRFKAWGLGDYGSARSARSKPDVLLLMELQWAFESMTNNGVMVNVTTLMMAASFRIAILEEHKNKA